MKKDKIYIDFDGTLFDTDAFYKEFLSLCTKNGITEEEVKECEKKIFDDNNLFNLVKLSNYIIEKFSLDSSLLDKTKSLFSDKFIYDDVIMPLRKLRKSYELILLTFGDEDQKDKISATGLEKYFSEIIITQKDKSQLKNVDYKNGIFIDNNPKELIRFYNKGVKKVIRIRRSIDKYSKIDTNIKEILEYEDFSELVEKEF